MSAQSSNTKYYKESFHLFKQCSKAVDREDLANKIFDELTSETSDTVKIMQACSKEFEQILPCVTSFEILTKSFDRFTDAHLNDLIRDRSACFVFEKFLNLLPKYLNETNQESIHSAFDRLVQCICEHFDEYILETGSSHIIASTIAFLQPIIPVNEYEILLDGGQTPKQFFVFSSNFDVDQKLKQFVKLIQKSSHFNEFIYATLLRTCGYVNRKSYDKLLERLLTTHFADLKIESILDKHSSFIFEVILEFPSNQRDTLLYPLVLDNIEQIYLHPIGNFFLQRLFLTLDQSDVLNKLYATLTQDTIFDKLLNQAHIHLLVTFIRACERLHCHYDELIQRLTSSNEFIPNLLKLRQSTSNETITKDGTFVLQALLRAQTIDNRTRQSFLLLSSQQICSIACHPQGSHLLCQLILKSKLWPLLRQKNIYQKLREVYTAMSCDKYACWVVTQLWKSAQTIDEKLHMAESMAKDFPTLRSHMYAKFITYEMNLNAYCNRKDQWKRSIELVLKKHALLDDIHDENQTKKKKKKKN